MIRRVPWVCSALLAVGGLWSTAVAENWPGWRGPRGDGTSIEPNVPTEWSATQNILWKSPVPGVGHASPIVWDKRIFTVTCLEKDQVRALLCYDTDGQLLWQREVVRSPLEGKHKLNSYASSTPCTDGTLVYCTFLEVEKGDVNKVTPGKMVVAAYDFDGNQKWLVRPGDFASMHGYCSSPILYQDLVIVNGDHDGESYLVALKRATGETVWKVPRENKTRSYCTPIIREIGGRTQMVLAGSKRVSSYDPANGKMWWYINGPTEQFVASLVYDGNLLFLTAGFPERHALAIKPDGDGNVTDTKIAWWVKKDASCAYVPSPIVCQGHYYIICDTGIGTCYDTATGERQWKERMGRHFSASLISANGLVYFLDDDGITKILKPGTSYEVVQENNLGEACFASPAISNGRIYQRAEKNLYCIGKK